MSSNWASPPTENSEQVQVARLESFEDGVATFGIHGTRLEIAEKFRWSPVTEGFEPVEEVPEWYTPEVVFRVVAPENGEFRISSYDRFVGSVGRDRHTIGPRSDTQPDSEHSDLIEEVLRSWI